MGYGKGSFINVVLKGGACTYLKPGFTNGTGGENDFDNLIFQPIPYDSLNMVTNEINIQNQRIKDDKDILEKVLPWIAMGLLIFGMVAIAYFHGQAIIKASENFDKAAAKYQEAFNIMSGRLPDDDRPQLGVQSTTTTTLRPPGIQ